MDPLTIGAIIAGGSSLLGKGLESLGQRSADNRYNESQIALQNLTNQQNIDFWHMQNAYNTPLQQMQRFKDAGLNPHLIYGKGTSGNAVQIAPSKRPDTRASNYMAGMPNVVASAASMMQALAQVKKTDSEREGQDIMNNINKLKYERERDYDWAFRDIIQDKEAISESERIIKGAESTYADKKEKAIAEKYYQEAEKMQYEKSIKKREAWMAELQQELYEDIMSGNLESSDLIAGLVMMLDSVAKGRFNFGIFGKLGRKTKSGVKKSVPKAQKTPQQLKNDKFYGR